mmetsp:Transcript_7269/g.16468  ORF Transcript_7269/g.16468 Transcript_7269/m.16468 type:complete len:248 (+) Transcript_7269:1259-2002(+)
MVEFGPSSPSVSSNFSWSRVFFPWRLRSLARSPFWRTVLLLMALSASWAITPSSVPLPDATLETSTSVSRSQEALVALCRHGLRPSTASPMAAMASAEALASAKLSSAGAVRFAVKAPGVALMAASSEPAALPATESVTSRLRAALTTKPWWGNSVASAAGDCIGSIPDESAMSVADSSVPCSAKSSSRDSLSGLSAKSEVMGSSSTSLDCCTRATTTDPARSNAGASVTFVEWPKTTERSCRSLGP